MAARSRVRRTVWPGSSTGRPGQSHPARGMPAPAGSSSLPASTQRRCHGRHVEPSAVPSCSPKQHRVNHINLLPRL